MSIILPLGGGQQPLIGGLRAYSDPVIFRDDRVFKTLLRKEVKYLPASPDYFTIVQGQELKPLMRKEVASWMLEICEAEQCQPEVFCLAMNYLDRFLSLCKIAQSQLQLLASVCLLVAWKVRQHRPLSATKLVEYSDFNLDVLNIMEWEVLLLSKLDWDMSSVIAIDFVEHIIQRLRILQLGWSPEMIRRHSEALVAMSAAHHSFYALAPSMVAGACVLTSLRPLLDALDVANPDPDANTNLPNLDSALDILEKLIHIEKYEIERCMDNIEHLLKSQGTNQSNPYATPSKKEALADDSILENEVTPTKVLDVVARNNP